MKSSTRIASQLSKVLLLALLLALAPAALAKSTWYVDGVNGNDTNDCLSSQTACKTIGHAISLASSGDTIMVAPAIYTENLIISTSLKIIGSGATTTIVDGGGVNTVVTIGSGTPNVILSKLTVRNGYSQDYSGGINNWGTLTVNKSTIAGNGGGITNAGTLTINNSTISGNAGGGIVSYGMLMVNNSTITGNNAYQGGGIYIWDGTANISSTTISGNISTGKGGGIWVYWKHGRRVTLQNTILAHNKWANCNGEGSFGNLVSNGYNLSSDGHCNLYNTGDKPNTKPKLGKLDYHGGPTQTIPLREGSPAIDAGNPNGCTDGNGQLLKTDQRGYPRPDKEDSSGCDIGAFERERN